MVPFILVFYFVIFFVIISRIVKTTRQKQYENRDNYTYSESGRQTVPDKYQTINSHYNQTTLNPQGAKQQMTKVVNNSAHKHAYEHKVEPIQEASVMDRFEDRKDAYIEKKKQMIADLPKTSYSQAQNQVKQSTDTNYRNVQLPYGRNGDNGEGPLRGENLLKCGYCGAMNIVPAAGNQKYRCYFCRQEI